MAEARKKTAPKKSTAKKSADKKPAAKTAAAKKTATKKKAVKKSNGSAARAAAPRETKPVMEISDEIAIEITDMHKWYGDFHVLKDISQIGRASCWERVLRLV